MKTKRMKNRPNPPVRKNKNFTQHDRDVYQIGVLNGEQKAQEKIAVLERTIEVLREELLAKKKNVI